MTRKEIELMGRDERIAFYLDKIKSCVPPKSRKQEVLLKVYRQLLAAAQDDGRDASSI